MRQIFLQNTKAQYVFCFLSSTHPSILDLCNSTTSPQLTTQQCQTSLSTLCVTDFTFVQYNMYSTPYHMLTNTYTHTHTHTQTVIPARPTTCPGLRCFSPSQRGSCLGTLGSSPAFHIQVQGQETRANSWRCAEGAWRLPQQMNHHRLIFNSRLLLPSSISASFLPLHTTFPPPFFHQSDSESCRYVGVLAYAQQTHAVNMLWECCFYDLQ